MRLTLVHCWLLGVAWLTGGLVMADEAAPAPPPAPILQTQFASDPVAAGWEPTLQSKLKPGAEAPPTWRAPGAADLPAGSGALLVNRQTWASPKLTLVPGQMYHLVFTAKAPTGGMWQCRFFGADDQELPADHWAPFPASETWRTHESVFMGRHGTQWGRLGWMLNNGPCELAGVTLTPITSAQAWAWTQRVAADLPPIKLTLPPATERHQFLSQTYERLRAGGPLKLVMLGDSIINDTTNSHFFAGLEELFPKAKLTVIHSVRSGTGMPWYAQENRLQRYVLDYQPDWVIIGGISHGYNSDAVFEVIAQLRAAMPKLEILVVSGTITEVGLSPPYFKSGMPPEVAAEEAAKERVYRAALAKGCPERQVAYFDLRGAFEDHLTASGKPRKWFLRDIIHGNDHGRVLSGHLLYTWLKP